MALNLKHAIEWKALAGALLAVYSFALIGGVFTGAGPESAWYEAVKPGITPPDAAFPIAWNALYFLIALSLYFAWVRSEAAEKRRLAAVFGANLAFNALWSLLFFRLREPGLALFDLALIWLTIWLMLSVTWRIRRLSAFLLVPYLLWVSFAGVLNFLIVRNLYRME